MEGAGEVQTPVSGKEAGALRVGDNVYMRHAKAGELCERFETLYLVEGGEVVERRRPTAARGGASSANREAIATLHISPCCLPT